MQSFGNAIRAELRKSDWVARYGGDEFAVLLPSADLSSARAVAERLREAVERTHIPHGGASVAGTVSVGIAEYLRDGLSG